METQNGVAPNSTLLSTHVCGHYMTLLNPSYLSVCNPPVHGNRCPPHAIGIADSALTHGFKGTNYCLDARAQTFFFFLYTRPFLIAPQPIAKIPVLTKPNGSLFCKEMSAIGTYIGQQSSL